MKKCFSSARLAYSRPHASPAAYPPPSPSRSVLSESLSNFQPQGHSMAATAATLQLSLHCFNNQNDNSNTSSLPIIRKIQPNHHHHLPNTSPKLLHDHIPISSNQFKEKILCLEIMGVDSSKALSLNPSLHTATLDSIQDIISFLLSKGIQQKDLARILGMCPKILTSSIKNDLLPVFKFLFQDLSVPDKKIRTVINKCPRLLVSSVRDQLKPALFYLQSLGFKNLDALACQDSVLLVSSVEKTLIPKLEYLVSIGFTKEDAVGMVKRCPGLFTFSIENNFKPKFGYFVEKMGGKLEQLKGFPQYFAFSLEKRIKPRHEEVVKRGVSVPLDLMLKSTNEEFLDLVRKDGQDDD